MSKFLTELDCHLKDDDKIWELDFSLQYESDILGKIIVPAGFQTDFSSVPRWIPIASNALLGKAHREGCLHDFAYRIDANISFNDANSLFLEAMVSRGKPWYIRLPMYKAVCWFGKSSYHKLYIRDALNKN